MDKPAETRWSIKILVFFALVSFLSGYLTHFMNVSGTDILPRFSYNPRVSYKNMTKIKLFVGVLSACSNSEKRYAVRQTWASNPNLERVVFVLSAPTNAATLTNVRQEAVRYQDVVVLNHVREHYLNITHQTLEVFRTAYSFHGNITHVLKCDDDSYIHVDRLLSLLQTVPRYMTWIGAFNKGYSPIRDPSSKWFVSYAEWPDNYSSIHWTNGPGYIITMDLARRLATGAVIICMPGTLFKLEDVAAGSWLSCLQKESNLNITLVSAAINILGCSDQDIVSHYITPIKLQCMFRQGGKCC